MVQRVGEPAGRDDQQGVGTSPPAVAVGRVGAGDGQPTSDEKDVNALVDNETRSSALDGANATFMLASMPIPGSVRVYKRGLRMRPGADHDYIVTGRTVTFNAGALPLPGDNLVVDYRTGTPDL